MSESNENDVLIANISKEISAIESQISKLRQRHTELEKKRNRLKDANDLKKSEKLGNMKWDRDTFAWSQDVRVTLENIFKIRRFRPKQLSAINATLDGHHALVVMPTGAGKSLCYQLPALIMEGITVIVSPLISLMEDQVRSLQRKGVNAKLMTSTSTKEETAAALNDLSDKKSTVKLLYATPERFAKSKRFMAKLQKCYAEGRLQRIAIDEVHCCSQWGHDFRPDYKFLGVLASMFPKIPILGLTATATAQVLNDVQKMLNIRGCLLIKSTFNRPNLYYHIVEKPSSQEECLNILEKLLKYRYKNQSGIIYAISIKDCEDLTKGMRSRGLKVASYHANLEQEQRSAVHIKWHDGHYQAVIATVAFGMGIDKPDVKFVIHHSLSKAMESYYQESGRAGRDGTRAECVMFYRLQDIFRLSTMVFSSNGNLEKLYEMVKYCLDGDTCRRNLIARHFGEVWGDDDCNKMCDICMKDNSQPRNLEIQSYCRDLCEIIDNAEKVDVQVTAQKLIDAWFSKGPTNLRVKKINEPKISRNVAEDVVAYLLTQGYLREDFHFTAYTTISYIKVGPLRDLLNDDSLVVKMNIRKYMPIDTNSLAPTSFLSQSKTELPTSCAKRKATDSGYTNSSKKRLSLSKKEILQEKVSLCNEVVCVD